MSLIIHRVVVHSKGVVVKRVFLNKAAETIVPFGIINIGNFPYSCTAVWHIDDNGVLAVVVKVTRRNRYQVVGEEIFHRKITFAVKDPLHFTDCL